jgi:hypothetical protein
MKADNSSFARKEKFIYLGTNVTNQNSIPEEIKSKLKLEMLAIIHCIIFCLPLLLKKLKIKIHRTTIFPIVLYGCETWSLTLKEEHRMRNLENTVLRGIFGFMSVEVTREWRKLHNEELNDLYSSPNFLRLPTLYETEPS